MSEFDERGQPKVPSVVLKIIDEYMSGTVDARACQGGVLPHILASLKEVRDSVSSNGDDTERDSHRVWAMSVICCEQPRVGPEAILSAIELLRSLETSGDDVAAGYVARFASTIAAMEEDALARIANDKRVGRSADTKGGGEP